MAIDLRSAIRILASASVLGLLGELLFHNAAWGLNIFFWVSALAAGALLLSKKLGRKLPAVAYAIGPAILLFAACFAFREAPELKLANGIALFLLVGTLLAKTHGGSLTKSSLYDLTIRAVGAWFKLTADCAKLVADERFWKRDPESLKRVRAVLSGLMIAAPLLLVFGGLFASADDAFRSLISNLFSFNWFNGPWLVQTVLIFCFCAVMAAGTYRVLLVEQETPLPPPPPRTENPAAILGMTEISVVLGLLNALFALFVVVQAQYFFGGVHHMRTVQGLTYAQYARHGFFELAAVAANAVAVILGFHAMMRDPERNQKSFGILAGILTALVSVVLVSAFQRMGLYVNFAGLTELRVYTTAFMVWIAGVLFWLGATVLRGRSKRFAWGAMVTGLATIVSLNVVNPDALIARVNLGLGGRQTDLAYLQSLSVDAAPAVISNASRLPSAEAANLRTTLRNKWAQEVDTDWRGIDYSRWRYFSTYRGEL